MKSRSLADIAKLAPYLFAKADVPAARAQRTERNHCLLPAVLWTASQVLPDSLHSVRQKYAWLTVAIRV